MRPMEPSSGGILGVSPSHQSLSCLEVFGDVFEVSLLQTSRHLSRVRRAPRDQSCLSESPNATSGALKPEPEEPEEAPKKQLQGGSN